MPLNGARYRGVLYRSLNPVYARDPLSGRGAAMYGGRFNPIGTPTLYAACDPATALREANQVGHLQPTMLVAYEADLGPIFDATDTGALATYTVTPQDLGDPGWRAAMLNSQAVPTQDLAMRLIKDGFSGIQVRSFAKGTTETNLNLVLWKWSGPKNILKVIDAQDRLRVFT